MAPFPEEINRQITGRIADFHFSPTEKSKLNLLGEGVKEEGILVTGNTVIDALLESVERVKNINENVLINQLKRLAGDHEIVLVTGHRRENFGDGFLNICAALKEIAKNFNGKVIYPVHLNPNVQKPVREILGDIDNIKLIAPLPYEAFVWMMNRSKLIITDSGGVQEEAPSLGKPVLVMRDTTERPEAVDAGTVVLVGTDRAKIVSEALDLLKNEERYKKMSALHNPYGDGKAAKRILEFLR
jgi:UDP-N-acetylglucosamine 2-epimerase (non-hydrolysing)